MAWQPNPNQVKPQMMNPAQRAMYGPPTPNPGWASYPGGPQAMPQPQPQTSMRPGQQSSNQAVVSQNVPDEPVQDPHRSFGRRVPGGLKGLFQKDLKEIMYGLGDSAPAPDTVALMEDILVEYLHEMVMAAGPSSKNISPDDLRRALQGPGDERKLARLEELIRLQVEIKKARNIQGLEGAGLRME